MHNLLGRLPPNTFEKPEFEITHLRKKRSDSEQIITARNMHWSKCHDQTLARISPVKIGFLVRWYRPLAETLSLPALMRISTRVLTTGREKSRMRTTYQNISMRFGFLRICVHIQCTITPHVMGFSGSGIGTTKVTGFWISATENSTWTYFYISTVQ